MLPHFYAFHSRLGLPHPPYRMKVINTGVEKGPVAILNEDFIAEFSGASGASVDSFEFTLPEKMTISYQSTIARDMQAAAKLVRSTLRPGETPVVVGGDHSVILAGLLALFERFSPQDVGYIQFDSHADMNTFATSTTGNFHGIYLRVVVGETGSPVIDILVPRKLPFENILFIGNLDLDPEEVRLFKEYTVKKFDKKMLENERELVRKKLSDFVAKFKHIHVSFDIDMFDGSVAPATGIACPDGPLPADIFPLLDSIKNSASSLSMDLVEVNPTRRGAAETVVLGQEVLRRLL